MDHRHGNEWQNLVRPAQNQPVATADRPLAQQLQELETWLRTLEVSKGEERKAWSKVLLAEEHQIQRRLPGPACLPSSALKTPSEFERRWQELIAEGRRDWINLSAYGVWQDALIVIAEPPAHGPTGSYAPEQISVNFSGPSTSSGWELGRELSITG
jgi:hypothetical protein